MVVDTSKGQSVCGCPVLFSVHSLPLCKVISVTEKRAKVDTLPPLLAVHLHCLAVGLHRVAAARTPLFGLYCYFSFHVALRVVVVLVHFYLPVRIPFPEKIDALLAPRTYQCLLFVIVEDSPPV